jgi:hypothetical protein
MFFQFFSDEEKDAILACKSLPQMSCYCKRKGFIGLISESKSGNRIKKKLIRSMSSGVT